MSLNVASARDLGGFTTNSLDPADKHVVYFYPFAFALVLPRFRVKLLSPGPVYDIQFQGPLVSIGSIWSMPLEKTTTMATMATEITKNKEKYL